MTIHSGHPFAPSPEDQDQARLLRSRLPAPVSIWTSAKGQRREGWTISSFLVATGDPAEMVVLVNEEADWWDMFRTTRRATVNVLGPGQGWISDVFARVAPSPGGPFRTGEWTDHDAGPRLVGAAGWAEVTLLDDDPPDAGWGRLVRARIDAIELPDGVKALEHRDGHYL